MACTAAESISDLSECSTAEESISDLSECSTTGFNSDLFECGAPESTSDFSDNTAAEISDTDSANTAIEFWDHRKMAFLIDTDEDGSVCPDVERKNQIIKWTFSLKQGNLVVEFDPNEMYTLVYGEAREADAEWVLRAQVRVGTSAIGDRNELRGTDADIFEFGTGKKPIRFNLKSRDVTQIKLDMRYIFEIYGECKTSLEDLDNILAIQPSENAKELLEKFYWSQRYNLNNLRRASLLRVETSCKTMVDNMKAMTEYDHLSKELQDKIEERFNHGWSYVRERLGYCEATSNIIREIVIGNGGKLFGGPDPEAINEASLATTYGMNSEEILGAERSIEVIHEGDNSEYVTP